MFFITEFNVRIADMKKLIWLLNLLLITSVSFAQVPTISSFSPVSGPIGTTVTITGTNLGSATAVDLGATGLAVTSDTANSISATVPAGLTAGTYDITVTNAGGTSSTSAADHFTVTSGGVTPPNLHYESAGGIMVAYPNPFNPNDTANPLKMLVGGTAGDTVSIYIFDANGRIIYQDKQAETDVHTVLTWDGQSSYGGTVNNGIYLIMIVNNGKLVAKGKILVIKK